MNFHSTAPSSEFTFSYISKFISVHHKDQTNFFPVVLDTATKYIYLFFLKMPKRSKHNYILEYILEASNACNISSGDFQQWLDNFRSLNSPNKPWK